MKLPAGLAGWLAVAGLAVSGFTAAGAYLLAVTWFGLASPMSTTGSVAVLLAIAVPLLLGALAVSLLWSAKAETPSWKAGSGWGAVVAFVAFWVNIIRDAPFIASVRASISIVVVGLVGGFGGWAISWWLLRQRSGGEPRRLKPWHLGVGVVVVGLFLAVTSGLLALGADGGSGASAPSMTVVGQQGDLLAGYKLRFEAVLAARAEVLATSDQRLVAPSSTSTRPLTASNLVIDELKGLMNRVREELPFPPEEPLRSLDAAWRTGILRWYNAEQALASEDSQENLTADQQAMEEEHSAVQSLTKYLTGSTTAPPTTTTSTLALADTGTETLKVDKVKFTAAWQALMKIEDATSVGVGYSDMRIRAQDFATQTSLLPQDMNDDEQLATLELLEISQAYEDSLALWKAQIDSSKSDAHQGGLIPYVTAEASWVSRYSLTFATENKTELTPDSIERIWSWARAKTDGLRSTLAP